MNAQLTISVVARRLGMSQDTLRFYEAEGLLPPPARTEAGYRLYGELDVRRLRLIRRLRALDLPLSEIKALVDAAFASECGAFGQQLTPLIERQQLAIDRRIVELQALRAELDTLIGPVRQVAAEAPPGLTVAACGRCPLIDEADEHGATADAGYCHCGPPPSAARSGPDRAPLARQLRRPGAAAFAILLCFACCAPPLLLVVGVALSEVAAILTNHLWVVGGSLLAGAAVLVMTWQRWKRSRRIWRRLGGRAVGMGDGGT